MLMFLSLLTSGLIVSHLGEKHLKLSALNVKVNVKVFIDYGDHPCSLRCSPVSSASVSINGVSQRSVTNREWVVSCLPHSGGPGSHSARTPGEIALASSARTTCGDIAVETLPGLLSDLQGGGIRAESLLSPASSHIFVHQFIKPLPSQTWFQARSPQVGQRARSRTGEQGSVWSGSTHPAITTHVPIPFIPSQFRSLDLPQALIFILVFFPKIGFIKRCLTVEI